MDGKSLLGQSNTQTRGSREAQSATGTKSASGTEVSAKKEREGQTANRGDNDCLRSEISKLNTERDELLHILSEHVQLCHNQDSACPDPPPP
ncbi:hypothetical protein ACOMHN_018457 [Nucella lapillus]